MSDFRVLVVEDEALWQEDISEELERLGGAAVSVAATYEGALRLIRDTSFDLALVDLSVPRNSADPTPSVEMGKAVLGALRDSPRNSSCGRVVLTARSTPPQMRESFKKYEVDDFIDKHIFHEEGFSFLEVLRAAVMAGRLRQAAAREQSCYSLEIEFDSTSLTGSELSGPDRQATYSAPNPQRFEVEDLARRADNLNLLVLQGGADLWRPEARSIGNAIYAAIASERRIVGDLSAARALARRVSDLRLRFSGPAPGLGVPFELLRDEDDYLGLSHVITRRVLREGPMQTRKPERFHQFMKDLWRNKLPLRVLVVGANSDGLIPHAEVEANDLAAAVEGDLQRLGLEAQVVLLSGAEATYDRVEAALRDGQFHVFHYAGHGRFDDQLAELSGLVLADGHGGYRTLTADILGRLVSETALRFAFLSCCLGARTAGRQGRGDFYGVLDALARADVPLILGYRWTVADGSAMQLASTFYQTLWRTFSPGEALLQARRAAAMGERGGDDETWASPILLAQNA